MRDLKKIKKIKEILLQNFEELSKEFLAARTHSVQ